jgi:hypothetical protein
VLGEERKRATRGLELTKLEVLRWFTIGEAKRNEYKPPNHKGGWQNWVAKKVDRYLSEDEVRNWTSTKQNEVRRWLEQKLCIVLDPKEDH